LRGSRDGELGLVVAPGTRSKAARKQQQRNPAEQRRSVTTSPLSRNVRQRNNAIGFRTTPLLNSFIIWPHTNLGHAGTSSNTPW
jgi:hypothetical protein